MVDALPPNWLTPGAGSLLGRLRLSRRRHPDEFWCAVRVLSGSVSGESARWSYRRSAVDPLRTGETVRLQHGDARLVLRFTGEQYRVPGLRMNHVAWAATDTATGAEVEVGAAVEHAVTFGVD